MQHFWANYWKQAALPTRNFTTLAARTLAPTMPLHGLGPAIRASADDTPAITKFLRANFRRGPFSPLYLYEVQEDEILLAVRDQHSAIAGTVRLRPAGEFEGNRIHLIDSFCIRPDWRRLGLGSYLLNQIHSAGASEGIHHAIFLKEGRSLDIMGLIPLYSSTYVCRETSVAAAAAAAATELESAIVAKLLHSYSLLRPDTFLILNWATKNQRWFHYKNGTSWILACIQNSYQQFKEESRPIGWMTGWIESPHMTDDIRYKAAIDICSAAGAYYNWVWMDSKWPGITQSNTDFLIDGSFHWYTYQWASGILPGRSYCIMA